MPEIVELLRGMQQEEASDLHLKVGSKPLYRVHGSLVPIESWPILSNAHLEQILREILTPDQTRAFDELQDLDFAYGTDNGDRFRCNCFRELRGIAAVFRRVPSVIPTVEELALPESIESFAHLRHGLVLLTGATGSGKSTTLAALINIINSQYQKHIITLEDPVEYTHISDHSVIHQRSLHTDFHNFQDDIVAALRQDPDVLLLGEMRDPETIRMALTAAETGVLVFSTLHSNGAAESIDRIVDVFPSGEQSYIRSMLSQTLAGIVHQVLLTRRDESGRIPATEVLVNTPAVSNLIREGRTRDLANVIQAGRAEGMHPLDDSLDMLTQTRQVSLAESRYYAKNKNRFADLPV